MTGDRGTGRADPVDVLALAEAVAAGRLGIAAAEAALWEARPEDQGRAADEVAEMRDLVSAIRGVRRHAEAVRNARTEVFDPDAMSSPLGSGRPPGEDRGYEPHRVRGGDVRLRPAARQRPRWAPVGALAAAAVLVVAVALVAPGLLAPTVATTPVPTVGPSGVVIATPSASLAGSPSPSPSVVPTSPPPPPTPAATGVKGVPALASEALAGAPGIAYWTLTTETKITITEWRPSGGPPRFRFSVTTLADPYRAAGKVADRRIVVSPDGQRMVFAETGTSTRTRVFATDGTLLWTDPQPTLGPDLAWSPDGKRLVIGSQPATWKILTFKASGPPTLVTREFTGEAFRVLGFSTTGDVLYGWSTQGEADFWQAPLQVVVSGGSPITIHRFSGEGDPLAQSNGTTDVTRIDPAIPGWSRAGVDPTSGRVLDTGDLSGQLDGWEVRDLDTGPGTKLTGMTPDMALAWAGDGSIVVADTANADRPATIAKVAVEAPGTPLTPEFTVPAGSYWRLFDGAQGGFALLSLATARSGDAEWLGAGELVAVELKTARSAVLVPSAPGLTGLHPAGWISAP